MTSHSLTRGSRVRDRIWGGTENGTVAGVDDRAVTIQWDSAEFTEDQRTLDDIEPIDSTGDPTPRHGVFYHNGTGAAPSTQDNDKDTDSL